jgi:endoglucanase
MLIAAAIGDRQRFDLAWQWAKANLQRPDGLLSWHWQGGRVVDAQPASDADLDAARALLVAADRFGVAAYRQEGLRIGGGVLGAETVDAAGPVLVAGPWATAAPRYVNPSYFSPGAFAALRRASGQRGWDSLLVSSQEVLGQLAAGGPGLPPDWAVLDSGGTAHPAPPPGGNGAAPSYSYDAARTFVRMGEGCSRESRQWASRAWPFFKSRAGSGLAATYDLAGHAQGNASHPLAYVAAAGSAIAAGDAAAGRSLLDRAEAAQAAAPTYYGAAWVALGRIMLTTDWLGGCA